MNLTIIKGRFTDDPKVTEFESLKRKAEFSLAVDRPGKDSGTDFPRFEAWDKKADIISKWFRKGSDILVEGHIRTGSYENKEGKKVYTTTVVVDQIHFCGKKDMPEEGVGQNSGDGFTSIPEGIEEEIPFN